MALNINFQGNIFSADGEIVDVKYIAFSHNISKWSNIRISEQGQYNVNFGDGDLNTQDGTVLVGDKITIAFWDIDKDRENELAHFSFVTFSYDKNSNTVQDVQLLPHPLPECIWDIPLTQLIDTSITATLSPRLYRSWIFSGKEHIQSRDMFGQVFFDFLDILSEEVDFEDGFSSTTSHTYDSVGTKTATAKFVSSYGEEVQCSKSIDIKYPQPTGVITSSKDPVILFDEVSIVDSVDDPYGTVISIEHFANGVLVEENSDTEYTYLSTLNTYGQQNFKMVVHWNDGFEDQSFEVELSVEMVNTPPTIEIFAEKSQLQKYYYNFSSIVNDLEDDNDTLVVYWSFYFKNTRGTFPSPFFGCSDSENQTEGVFYRISSDKALGRVFSSSFAQIGTYKLVATVSDSEGLSSTAEIEFDVTETCIAGDGSIIPNCDEEIELALEAERIEFWKIINELRLEVEKNQILCNNNMMSEPTMPTSIMASSEGKISINSTLAPAYIAGISEASSTGLNSYEDFEYELKDTALEDSSGAVLGGSPDSKELDSSLTNKSSSPFDD